MLGPVEGAGETVQHKADLVPFFMYLRVYLKNTSKEIHIYVNLQLLLYPEGGVQNTLRV